MKKTVKLLFLILSCVFIASCSDDYNDSFIRNEIAEIKTDLSALKKQVSSIQTLVDVLNSGKVITEVKQLEDKTGHLISFNDGSSIQLTNGTNGTDGINGANAPIIGIGESEGTYYWTLTSEGETEFLLDQKGQKLPVSGIDGKNETLTGLVIDEEGYWAINGERLLDKDDKPIKAAGESLIKEVKDEEDSVTFILSNGEEITIPKVETSHLRFEKNKDGSTFYIIRPNRPNRIKFEVSSDISNITILSSPEGWTTRIVNTDVNKMLEVFFTNTTTYANEEIRIQGIDQNGLTYVAIASVSVQAKDYDDPKGTFILNEGSMTTENGSLIYITPTGEVRNNVYYNANGRKLGNVTQDMFFYHDKIYIIAQNGNTNAMGSEFDNEGKLVIANAKTLKKEASFNDELKDLSWPTHIAVLDEENIFIRDNAGIHSLNSKSGEVQFIQNSNGAVKNRMAVANHKVFASAGSQIFVLEANQNKVAKTIDLDGTITGLIPTDDGHLFAATTGKKQFIYKIDSETFKIIQSNEVTVGKLTSAPAATPGISAKGNLIYYGGLQTKIYLHNFETGESKQVADVKDDIEHTGIVYNCLGVHPLSGEIFFNTLKGFSLNYLTNNISVYSPNGETLTFKTTYKDYTRFPAGVFFRGNYPEASSATK